MSDLQIIFYIRILIRNVLIVLDASVMDATGLQALHRKIKLLDFSVKGLQMLRVINIHNLSVCNLYVICKSSLASLKHS